ncbi:MAG: hypothetical protein EAZ44_03480 [Cytophagia bacterium]|nr:MAG: hypothetical protein EAY69_10445 [Cytophagales bacterium]TAG05572.1 MAG: hypothetical protein EAZ44_03480 [Cytophagia bacterium]TAG43924.1 MAG: hypothetical protein EAZ31_03225 [Cytophagia bacterium]
MEIEIKNFGPIDNLKFDLNKDLHLIYGKNAIGKSYATYCLYCLIKNIKSLLTNNHILNIHFYLKISDKNEYEKMIASKIKNIKVNEPINFTDDFLNIINNKLKEIILKGLENSLENTFSSLKNLKNRYSTKNYEIIIHISENEKLVIFSDDEGKLDLNYIGNIEKVQIIQKSTKSTKYSLYINERKEFAERSESEFCAGFSFNMMRKLNQIFQKLNFNIRDIYYLPASRSGLYQALNAFTPIIAELTQNRFFMQNKSIELPSLSEPLADYFIDLSTIDKNNINKEFEDIIRLIQNNILKGNIEYNEKTKKILYKPEGIELELNLSEASSMVAELSPLVLYMRHILNNKYSSNKANNFFAHFENINNDNKKKNQNYDILFIEEPEAHLHPEMQVELLNIFAKLSALNLKIFITSHSNYMFNKLNNLLIKKEIDKNKVMVYHLIKTQEGTRVDTEMVVTEEGVNDYNFQDVSEKLYMERLNYLEENDN